MNNDKNSHQITSSGTTAHPEQTVPDNNPATLSYKEWREKFRPIKNPFTDAHFHGTLFRRHGVEFEMLSSFPLRQIWAVVCEDDFCSTISSYVARVHHIFGFIITEVAAPHDRVVKIPVFQHEEFDDEI